MPIIEAEEFQKIPELQKNLNEAARAGDLDEVKRLVEIEGADPMFGESKALLSAASTGEIECVKYLAPLSDPKAGIRPFMKKVQISPQVETMSVMFDTDARNSAALQHAAMCGSTECVEFLIPLSDVEKAKEQLAAFMHHDAIVFLSALDERMRINAEKARLSYAGGSGENKPARKEKTGL